MIPDSQAVEIIAEHFPEINMEDTKSQGIFKTFEVITDYAILLLETGRHNEFENFCKLICDLYGHCSKIITTAVENVYIYKLSAHIEVHTNRKELLLLLPERLRGVMVEQFNSSAI